jgi:hypothetical protein
MREEEKNRSIICFCWNGNRKDKTKNGTRGWGEGKSILSDLENHFQYIWARVGWGSQEMDRNNRKLEAAIAAVCCTHHDGWAKGAEWERDSHQEELHRLFLLMKREWAKKIPQRVEWEWNANVFAPHLQIQYVIYIYIAGFLIFRPSQRKSPRPHTRSRYLFIPGIIKHQQGPEFPIVKCYTPHIIIDRRGKRSWPYV